MTTGAAVVLVGPTAVGKSAVAMTLAGLHDGVEILSADSMCVYRGMDIGTAKPSSEDRRRVPHHLIDIVDVGETYTVARFVADAESAGDAIATRGGRALVVGGTGLYTQAFVDGLDIPGRYPEVRAELEAEADTRSLWRRLETVDPVAAARMEPDNRRRVVRALEVTLGSGRRFSSHGPGLDAYPDTPHLLVGLDLDREALDRRIDTRFDAQMDAGLLDEVRTLSRRPMGATAAQGLGYKELLAHLHGAMTLEEAVAEAKRRIRRFARRQQRWFRRDPRIRFVDAADNPVERVGALVGEFWGADRAADPIGQPCT